jgi:O-antigen/teichoic acid export membrane protein
MTLAYGPKYVDAIPVMMIAAALAIPRAFQNLPDTLLRAADRQTALLKAMILTGVINVLLDVPLILRYGAIGAAIGNGIAQTIGVVLLWRAARREYFFQWPFGSLLRFAAAGLVMACGAFFAARPFSPAIGIAVAITIAAPLYIVGVRVFGAFDPEDLGRLTPLAARLPGRVRPLALFAFQFAVRADRPGATAAGYNEMSALRQERQ